MASPDMFLGEKMAVTDWERDNQNPKLVWIKGEFKTRNGYEDVVPGMNLDPLIFQELDITYIDNPGPYGARVLAIGIDTSVIPSAQSPEHLIQMETPQMHTRIWQDREGRHYTIDVEPPLPDLSKAHDMEKETFFNGQAVERTMQLRRISG